ncbi:hypothetical protein Mal4_36510 [Maioricimonas rarisocia]|uniref:Uncharacterized protein n=1 Tax=Maioricimonas rarisocia TaxID=2528026 RepID=A0A517Z9Z5_9PLAN|nr:hypothetical protein [Maioricimonas rarisocia]QDU39312.1 hypothetical protein Mal4_36510 [Maioricimonas rarisocia]
MKHLVHKLANRSMWSRRGTIWAGIVLAMLSLSALLPSLIPSEAVSRSSDGIEPPASSPQPSRADDAAVVAENVERQLDVPEADEPATTASAASGLARDTVTPADIIGTWRLKQQGERVVTMRDDGSALMQVVLDFFGALLYGESMTLELEWTLEDGILTHRVIRGQPEQSVARLIRDYGDARSYRVVSCGDELVLEAVDSPEDVYHWTAVSDGDTERATIQ